MQKIPMGATEGMSIGSSGSVTAILSLAVRVCQQRRPMNARQGSLKMVAWRTVDTLKHKFALLALMDTLSLEKALRKDVFN